MSEVMNNYESKKKLYILGAGGLGREVLWNVKNNKILLEEYVLVGFIDDLGEIGREVNGIEVVGNSENLLKEEQEIGVIIAIGDRFVRKEKFDMLSKNPNIHFPNMVAESANLDETNKLGQGNIILDGAKFSVNIELGDFNLIYISCVLTHDVKIGNFNSMYTGAIASGEVRIKDFCDIGTGAIMIPRVSIESNTIIGAGAVVVKNTEGNETLVGVPAKRIN